MVFPRIAAKKVTGYRGIQLLRSAQAHQVDFVTIMAFDDWPAVREFAGEDYEQSYVIDEAKKLLHHYDGRAKHYELVVEEGKG